jgi:hypothetical protein
MYVSTSDIYESVTENQILPWYYQLDLKFLEDGLCIGSVYRFMAGFVILLIPILARRKEFLLKMSKIPTCSNDFTVHYDDASC